MGFTPRPRQKKRCKHGPLSLLGFRAGLKKDFVVLFKSGSDTQQTQRAVFTSFFSPGRLLNPGSFCSFSFIFSHFTIELQWPPLCVTQFVEIMAMI